jgi:hypothetical protein
MLRRAAHFYVRSHVEIVDIEAYRPALEAALRQHSPQPVDVLVVESIAEWCEQNGGSSAADPAGMAVTMKPNQAWRILLRRTILRERWEVFLTAY